LVRVAIDIRSATHSDEPLLHGVLGLAFNWRGAMALGDVDRAMTRPEIGHYITGWPQHGEVGFVAYDSAGPLGAVWWRLWAGGDTGYGYVSADIPELTLGVVAAYRGQGVGRALMEAIIEAGWRQSPPALSLSVEVENIAAHRLYRHLGFEVVGRVGEADTMVLQLGDQPLVHA
jgi:ribosomal protein S18 acetylase RimI-like enzyme